MKLLKFTLISILGLSLCTACGGDGDGGETPGPGKPEGPDKSSTTGIDRFDASNIFSRNTYLPANTAMQGFNLDSDGSVWYTQLSNTNQAQLNWVRAQPNKTPDVQTENKDYMKLTYFGHGTNTALEEDGADRYLWAGAYGVCNAKGQYWNEKLVGRVKYVKGATVKTNECNDYYYIGDYTDLHPSIDAENDLLTINYGDSKNSSYRCFVIYKLSEAKKAPMTNVSNMMTGKLPGVTSIQRSGQPGSDGTTIFVRGVSSFNNSSPLCIVDGVERMINTVNPNDIESISILKDAATSAIYGVRGANGVILITTKTGSKGAATISYDGSATFTTNVAMPEMLNAQDYIGWHNKAREMDGLNPLWTDEVIAGMKEKGIYGETDWMDLLFKNYGFTHQHNISATGGTDRVKYYTSIGMMNQDGILPNTSYQRFNVRANIDTKIAKNFNLNVNIAAFREDTHAPGYSLGTQGEFNPISQALFSLPIIAPTYNDLPQGYMSGVYTQQPIAAVNKSGFQDTKRWQFEGIRAPAICCNRTS